MFHFRSERSCEYAGAVARAVICHHRSDGHPGLSKERSGAFDEWRGVSWEAAESNGAPVIDEVTGWVAGHVEREIEAGDHLIFLIRVSAVQTAPDIEPLVFHRGAYRELEYMI